MWDETVPHTSGFFCFQYAYSFLIHYHMYKKRVKTKKMGGNSLFMDNNN